MNGKPETTAPVKASRRRSGGNHGEYDAAWNFISAKCSEFIRQYVEATFYEERKK